MNSSERGAILALALTREYGFSAPTGRYKRSFFRPTPSYLFTTQQEFPNFRAIEQKHQPPSTNSTSCSGIILTLILEAASPPPPSLFFPAPPQLSPLPDATVDLTHSPSLQRETSLPSKLRPLHRSTPTPEHCATLCEQYTSRTEQYTSRTEHLAASEAGALEADLQPCFQFFSYASEHHCFSSFMLLYLHPCLTPSSISFHTTLNLLQRCKTQQHLNTYHHCISASTNKDSKGTQPRQKNHLETSSSCFRPRPRL